MIYIIEYIYVRRTPNVTRKHKRLVCIHTPDIHSILNSLVDHVEIVSINSLLFLTDAYFRKCNAFNIVWYAMLNKVQFCHQSTSTKIGALIESTCISKWSTIELKIELAKRVWSTLRQFLCSVRVPSPPGKSGTII